MSETDDQDSYCWVPCDPLSEEAGDRRKVCETCSKSCNNRNCGSRGQQFREDYDQLHIKLLDALKLQQAKIGGAE